MTLDGDNDVAAMFAGLANLGGAESQCAGSEFGAGDDTRHDHHRKHLDEAPDVGDRRAARTVRLGTRAARQRWSAFSAGVSFALPDSRAKDNNKNIEIPLVSKHFVR
jgi:hypothetical protein